MRPAAAGRSGHTGWRAQSAPKVQGTEPPAVGSNRVVRGGPRWRSLGRARLEVGEPHHAVGDGPGLLLVVGHVQRRDAQAAQQLADVGGRAARAGRGRARRTARRAAAAAVAARAPGPARPAAPGRRTACRRRGRRSPARSTRASSSATRASLLGRGIPAVREPVADVAAPRRGAGRARRPGRPARCAPVRRGRRRGRRRPSDTAPGVGRDQPGDRPAAASTCPTPLGPSSATDLVRRRPRRSTPSSTGAPPSTTRTPSTASPAGRPRLTAPPPRARASAR